MTRAFDSIKEGLQQAAAFMHGDTSAGAAHITSAATGEPLTYRAVVEPAGEGFSVYFPDMPGCTSAGGNVAEALQNAQEALNSHLSLMVEHGDEIPLRRSTPGPRD